MGFLSGGIIGSVIGGPVGGLIGLSADANRANANAMREMSAAQLAAWKEANKQTRADLAPWMTMGTGAAGRLYDMNLGTTEQAMNAMMMDPGYQFRLDQGQQALERSAAARGNLFSGNTGIALNEYGQGMASDEFGKAYNRLMGLSTQGLGATEIAAQGNKDIANASSNAAYMNMNADISRNNFWPDMAWGVANTALKAAPMFAGMGSSGGGSSTASFSSTGGNPMYKSSVPSLPSYSQYYN